MTQTTALEPSAGAPSALAIRADQVLPVLADPRHVLSAEQVKLQAGLLQQVMEAVMIPGVHFGTVDGKAPKSRTLGRTHQDDYGKKETLMLYQPGAEKLLLTFCLRPVFDDPVVESERSQHGGFLDMTVRCKLLHVGTGTVVGEALGNCNSRERKYRWRTVYPDKAMQWERDQGKLETRTKRDGNGTYDVLVLEVDPWEIKQTILAQAQKRAMVRATRTALAAGDLLGVDEDQAQALRTFADEHAEDAEVELATEDVAAANNLRERAAAAKAGTTKAQPAAQKSNGAAPAAMDPAQQELHDLRTHAVEVARRLKNVPDYTLKDYQQLVRSACGGRTHDPAQLSKDELVAFVEAGLLVIRERGEAAQVVA